MLNEVKNMAVVGIVIKDKEYLFKTAVWDNAYLDIKYKLCTKSELEDLVHKNIPINSYKLDELSKKVVVVDYLPMFEPMVFAWIPDDCSFMYSYFDCLRWCLSESISIYVNGVEIHESDIDVDLQNLKVTALGITLFEYKNGPVAMPFKINVSELDKEQYKIAEREFNLDGTEYYFEYSAIECVSSRNRCSAISEYAKEHGTIGKLYAIDQILGGM